MIGRMAFLRSRYGRVVAGLAVALAVGGCQAILGIDDTSFEPSAGDAGSDASDGATDAAGDGSNADAAPPSPALHVSPTSVYLHQNDTIGIDVSIDRAGFAGDVTVSLATVDDAGVTGILPGANGISAPPLVIPAGQTTGTIDITADGSSSLGSNAISLEADFATPAFASISALVGGAAGTADITFGTNGVVSDVPSNVARGVTVAPDGSLYVVGGTGNWLVRHYFESGAPDATFNSAIAAIPSINGGLAWDVALNGSVLLVCGHEATSKFAVRRFSTSGSLDVTFGNSGMFTPGDPVGPQTGDAYGVAFSATGEGLAVGTITQSSTTTGYAVRFPPVGNTIELLAEYHFDTTVLPHAVAGVPDAFDVVGAYVGATRSLPDAGSTFLVQALDVGFQDAGTTTGGGGNHGLAANDAVLTPDGGVVVAGIANNDILPGDTFVTFGTSPLAPIVDAENGHHGTWDSAGYRAVAVQADGKILVVSDGGGSQSQETDVARYLPNGTLDSSFGTGGVFSVEVGGNGFQTNFYDVTVAPDGRIVVVGTNENTGIYITRIWP